MVTKITLPKLLMIPFQGQERLLQMVWIRSLLFLQILICSSNIISTKKFMSNKDSLLKIGSEYSVMELLLLKVNNGQKEEKL